MKHQDNNSNTFEVTLHLELHQLCRAASLGGHFIGEDDMAYHEEQMLLCHDIALITHLFAKVGLERALQRYFEQVYPVYYPDDVESLSLKMNSSNADEWNDYFRGEFS